MQCLHVAAVAREYLQAVGIADDRLAGALGFAGRFGFYVIQRPQ